MFFSKYDQWKTQSPPDYSPAYEQAEEEVRAGDFEDEYREEFEEELGWDEEPEEGDHERWLAKAEMAYENYGWREWYNVVQSYFPKTCDVVETRLVERRAEEIIEDHGGPW
jgi:hypothetical protein